MHTESAVGIWKEGIVHVFIIGSSNNDDSAASEHSVAFSDEDYDVEVEEHI